MIRNHVHTVADHGLEVLNLGNRAAEHVETTEEPAVVVAALVHAVMDRPDRVAERAHTPATIVHVAAGLADAIAAFPRVVALLPRMVAVLPRVVAPLPRTVALLPRVVALLPRVVAVLPRVVALLPRVVAPLPRMVAPLARVVAINVLDIRRRAGVILAGPRVVTGGRRGARAPLPDRRHSADRIRKHMAKLPNAPPDNIFAIDLSPLKTFLVDLPPRAMIGMRREHEGWKAAQNEVVANQPKYGDRAGITKTDFDRFVQLNEQHGEIQKRLPPVMKAVEVLTESLAHVDHQRHRLATQFANSAESHAAAEGGDTTLRTAYEKTIRYRSVIADKAVRTRQKNEQEAASAGEATDHEETDAAEPADGGGEDATEGTAQPAEGTARPGQGISRMPKAAPDNIFEIDLSPLKAFLVDLPAGATRGMRQQQDGWEAVRQEIIANQPVYGDRTGITKTDFDRFVVLNDQYEQILAVVPVVEKAAEVLRESLAHTDNLRHKLCTQFADSAEHHAASEGDPTLLTAYEKTIRYRSIIADKAVKARKKNE